METQYICIKYHKTKDTDLCTKIRTIFCQVDCTYLHTYVCTYVTGFAKGGLTYMLNYKYLEGRVGGGWGATKWRANRLRLH